MRFLAAMYVNLNKKDLGLELNRWIDLKILTFSLKTFHMFGAANGKHECQQMKKSFLRMSVS